MANIPASGLELGFVVASYPEGQSVDVLLPNSGARLSNVQVMVLGGSDKTGRIDLPSVGLPADDTRWNLPSDPSLMIRAVIGVYYGCPVCLGFIMPQVTQMTFKRTNFRVDRHPSDLYTTVSDNGDLEVYHPSGTYFRISTSTAHEDLTGQDYDQLWKLTKNLTSAPHVHLVVANAGVTNATFDIDPSGNVTGMAHSFNFNGVTIDSSGNLNSPATITAATDVVQGAGGTAISLKNHVQSGVQGGSSNSGPPVPGT